MVNLLLAKGANINAFDKKDRRALHWAAYMGKDSVNGEQSADNLNWGSSKSLTYRVDFLLGEPDFFPSLGSNWIKIQSLLLARIELSSRAVASSGIYLSYKEQERGIMARTSLNVLQSGLESCTNCAYVNFLWQQNKVFKEEEDWLAKQGCKFHLSFYF